jgi:hypothetical protein
MPRVLAELPVSTRSSAGRPEKHPFDEWFDGNVYELVEGEDFDSKRTTMATVLHTAATKRDLVVQTRITKDGIAIQARPITDEDKARRAEIAKKREATKAAKAKENGNGSKAAAKTEKSS